ncbi:ABC transporter permease [uncultured Draconibacterium sp.]|uniref:ABC transporter permease n=1 Tax=uncultured Draconibacterium sp. TaxID=1573823 RepID=UPI0029C63FFF|nr:ABC transporter permease [uncultured Draconibacterium sp.]
MLKHIFKITFRNILNSKVYTVINILGLSLGLTCALIIALWVKYELSFDTFHEKSQDLYKAAFCYEPQDLHGYVLPAPVAQQLKDKFPDVKNTTVFVKQENKKIIYNKNGFLTSGSFVDSSFFSMFEFPFLIGSSSEALIDPNSIVLTKSLAEKIFGEKNPLGDIVELDLNGIQQFVVSGVLKDIASNSDLKFDFLIPYELISEYLNSWDFKAVETYVQLKSNTDYELFNSQIAGVISEFKPDWNNRLYITPLTRCHLYNLQGGGRIQSIYIFSVVAIMILIIATFNFINLAMARSDKRIKEIGVKRIMGTHKKLLIFQFLYEAQVMAFIAMILSVIFIELILPSVNTLLNLNLDFDFTFYTIATLLGFSFFTGLVSGIYPAFFLSSIKPIDILKNNIGALQLLQRRNDKHNYAQKFSFRSVLVTFQFALTIILITGIIVVRQQLQYLKEKDLGFDKENILVVDMQDDLQGNYEAVKNQLLQLPGITNVSASESPLTKWQSSCTPDWEGKSTDNIFDMGVNSVDYNFAKTLGIEIKEGRFLSREYSTDANEGFVINEAAVKAMELKNPVGKSMSIFEGTPYERTGKIIGIIKNMHTESLYADIKPFVYKYAPAGSYMYIKTNSSANSAIVETVKSTIKQIVPDDPGTLGFLDENLNELYLSEQTTEKLMEYSSFIAIIISCLGLFGLSFFSTKLRIKEIGVRKVNGAKITEILAMLNKDFVKWVIIAFIIATPIAWVAMNQWLESFAYKTNLSWWIFALAGLLALGIALLTVSWQSWRAATRNPVEALRYE